MKIGRNAPCPCGSGKKYKKCCSGNPGLGGEPEPISGAEKDSAGEEKRSAVDDSMPPLSAADQKIVDGWWDATASAYKKRDAEEMIRRVLEFHEARSDLFEYLNLHEEFLFELGADLGRRGQHSRYAELLMRLRREQPGMYERSFGYYDLDIISELVVQNRRAEVPDYWGGFVKHPDRCPDQCEEVIDLLAWKGWDADLFALVSAIAPPLMTSRNVIGGSFAAEWLVFRAYQPHLVAHVLSPDAAESLFREFQSWDKPIRPALTRDGIDENLRLARQAPSKEAFKKGYGRKREDYIRMHGAFLRFLRNDRLLPWTTARFLADRLLSFWHEYRRDGLPGDALFPNAADIEKCLARTCVKFFSFEGVRLLPHFKQWACGGRISGKKGS